MLQLYFLNKPVLADQNLEENKDSPSKKAAEPAN